MARSELKKKRFTVDARTVLALGRDSIKDHTTAVLELVKNSYDAGATATSVRIKSAGPRSSTQITVSDNGQGMSESDVEQKWLRIGFSEKRKKKKVRGRRRVGEKGIGRLSADRLGSKLELRSQAAGVPSVGLKVDWDSFDAPGTDLTDVPLDDLDVKEFYVPEVAKKRKTEDGGHEYVLSNRQSGVRCTGTELKVLDLRQRWTTFDIEDLHRELSVLTPPFGNVVDFQVQLFADTDTSFDGVVSSPFYQAAELEADFDCSDDGVIKSVIKTRRDDGSLIEQNRARTKWGDFVHQDAANKKDDATSGNGRKEPDPRPTFGPVKVKLLFYPRVAGTLRGTELSLAQLKAFLDTNAGVKVYRDRVRVMPYGDPKKAEGGDWLALGDRKARNPAGAGRKDYRVAPNQLVGAVFLERDQNPFLIDTSGREGLVHGEAFIELKSFLVGCIIRLEASYHDLFVARNKAKVVETQPRESMRQFGEELNVLKKTLSEVKTELPRSADRRIERAQDQIGTAVKQLDEIQRSMEELASQNTIYRGLASIGIASATFSHETDAALEQFLSSLQVAKQFLKSGKPDIEIALDELEKSLSAAKRISAWGRFAIRRIKPDKRTRKNIDVKSTLLALVEELKEPFAASEIKLTDKLSSISGRFFEMDIESVALNLLTNAYFFSKISRRARLVSLQLKKSSNRGIPGFEISVGDSGPGVEAAMREKVWEPLVSTKVDERGRAFGTGLGLSIVDNVVSDLGGTRSVARDPVLKGALFTVWLPLR